MNYAQNYSSSQGVRFGSNAGKQRPGDVGAGLAVRPLAVYGGLCGCVAMVTAGCVLCTAGGPDVHSSIF